MRRIRPAVTLLACLGMLLAACSSGHTAVPEVSSTTGPAVTARLDRCFIDPSLDHQVVADVTAFNNSGAVLDIVVTLRMSADEGTHDDLAFVHTVNPGRSGNGGTSNHIPDSHQPGCAITGVEGRPQ